MSEISAPILALLAGADQTIAAEDNAQFEQALTATGVEDELVTYDGAPHSFFHPGQEDFADAPRARVLAFVERRSLAVFDRPQIRRRLVGTESAGTSLSRRQIEALEIAEGYFASQVLFSANELGVFALLAESPRSALDLAEAIGAEPDPLERLLNACVSVGLLSLSDGRYENSSLAMAVLVPGGPGYMGNWMRLMSRWMSAWTGLTESVRTGKPAEDPQLHLGQDAAYTEDFILAMDDYARLRGSEIVRYLDLSGGLRLIDVGGGPGTYAALFAAEWPDLQATVFDLPSVLTIAQRRIAEAGLSDRVSLAPGDYHQDEFGEGYDVVFLSDTLHQESPEICELILRKAHRALRPGGQVIVQAMFLNESRTRPRWPVMHSLILLLVYGAGRAYTVGETVDLMERAGFVNCVHRRMSLLNVNSLVTADKD